MRTGARPAAAIVVACLAASGCAADDSPHARAVPVAVSVSSCGQGWSSGHAGRVRFRLHDADSRPGEMRLLDAGSKAVYADVEPLGPGTRRDLTITLGPGDYLVQCLMEDEAPVTGRAVHVSGRHVAGAARAVAPADQGALVPATQSYQRWVRGRLPVLAAQVTRLRDDVRRGAVGAARRDWLTAHATYHTLGAAYDAFGDLGDAVDGLPDGLPRGTADPDWHGFHRLERGLWRAGATRGLAHEGDLLVANVARLRNAFGGAQIDPLDVTIRAHEIAEDDLQQVVTGHDDLGSHSDLATVQADLLGARVVLAHLRTLLRQRGFDVDRLVADLRSTADLAARLATTTHGPVTALPRPDRERLDAAVSALTEALAPVASVLEPRRTS